MDKKNRKKGILSYLLPVTCYLLLVTFLTGCATTRPQEFLPDYTLKIEGKKYLSLINLCYREGISWDYDSIAQVITLSKDNLEARLMLGGSIVLLDGRAIDLALPAKLHRGMVVVPYSFKREALREFLGGKPGIKEERKTYYKIKKVCLDPGHGGKDPGAIGRYGLKEKEVNLDIVRRMKKELAAQGIEVITTRSSDIFIPLTERAEIANKSGADLFISVHANANRRRGLSGFEIYYISNSADDTSRALVLAKEGNSLSDGEAGLYSENTALSNLSINTRTIILDLILNQNRYESVKLAQHICKSYAKDVGLKVLGIKSAEFAVLKRAQMPAVLAEVGYISNAKEERYLKNSFYRQQIAESLVSGILSYKRYAEGE